VPRLDAVGRLVAGVAEGGFVTVVNQRTLRRWAHMEETITRSAGTRTQGVWTRGVTEGGGRKVGPQEWPRDPADEGTCWPEDDQGAGSA